MLHRLSVIAIIYLLLVLSFTIQAQGAPEPINDAIADLSNRVGTPLTIRHLDQWLWSQAGYEAACSDGTPPDAPGFQFLLTYGGNVYDYRVTANRVAVTLCSVTPEQANVTPEPAPADPEDPPYSNPLCPAPTGDLTYPPTRLAVEIQAQVLPGLPNNLRDGPSTQAAVVGETPGASLFNVLAGPECDEAGRLWWQVDFDGLVGWTIEFNGDYLLEPLPGAPLVGTRSPITADTISALFEASRLQGNFGGAFDFGPLAADGTLSRLVVAGDAGSELIWLFDLAMLDASPRTLQAPQRITQIDFDQEVDLVALGDAEGGIRLWDIVPGARLMERAFLLGHDAPLTILAYGEDGLASSGGKAFLSEDMETNQHAVILWSVETVSQTRALRGHTNTVTGFAYLLPKALTSSRDETVRLWDLETGSGTIIFEADAAIHAMAYHADSSLAALGLDDGTVNFISVPDGNVVSSTQLHSLPITSIDFSPDGTLIVAGSEDGTATVWPVNGLEPHVLYGHEKPVQAVGFSPDGTLIGTLGEDNTLRIWRVILSVG